MSLLADITAQWTDWSYLRTEMPVETHASTRACVKEPGGHLHLTSVLLPAGSHGTVVEFWDHHAAPEFPGQHVLVRIGQQTQPLYVQACALRIRFCAYR